MTDGAERRFHERTEICVPATVRALDESGRHAISEHFYAVVRDISIGGCRFDVRGQAAELLARDGADVARVELSFVPLPLRDQSPLRCRVRWSRRSTGAVGGITVGVQFGDVRPELQQSLLDRLLAYETRAARGRIGRWASIVVVVAVVVAATVFGYRMGSRREASHLHHVEQLAQRVERSEGTLRQLEMKHAELSAENAGLRADVTACREASAACVPAAAPAAPRLAARHPDAAVAPDGGLSAMTVP